VIKSKVRALAAPLVEFVLRNAITLWRFVRLYGGALFLLVVGALIAWGVAEAVSDYTQRGWEIHILQPTLGINLHFHHWYFGIPLALLAFLLLDANATASIVLFGMAQSLSAHSFINEGGIPSVFENGATFAVPSYLYFPITTGVTMLYMFFVMRREEWLRVAREREEIAISYFSAADRQPLALAALDRWAMTYFQRVRRHADPKTGIHTGQYSLATQPSDGLWSLEYASTPYDDGRHILVVRLQHSPFHQESARLLDWLNSLHAAMAAHARFIVELPGPDEPLPLEEPQASPGPR
jgi:hypothetical protein